MADRKQGAGWSSGSSAAGHKAHSSYVKLDIERKKKTFKYFLLVIKEKF